MRRKGEGKRGEGEAARIYYFFFFLTQKKGKALEKEGGGGEKKKRMCRLLSNFSFPPFLMI